jgi:hypothetical protein
MRREVSDLCVQPVSRSQSAEKGSGERCDQGSVLWRCPHWRSCAWSGRGRVDADLCLWERIGLPTGGTALSGETCGSWGVDLSWAVAASRTMRRAPGVPLLATVLWFCGCTTVDPGRTFSIPATTFDADYFYCHVEPEFIVAKHCGPGDPSKGESNSCHFTPSAVTGMVLTDHTPVDCGGGDHPVNRAQIGTGSAAQGNLEAVSFEMQKSYEAAPLFVRPSGMYHPRQIFDPSDMQVRMLLSTWASR